MPLFTPSNLKYIISLSIFSRVIVFIIQVIASFIIDDHNAVAYRNPYHIALTREVSETSSISLPVKLIYRIIRGYTRWDSQYFLEIANDGYVSEKHLAFLPMYPMTISLVRQMLFGQNRIDVDSLLPKTKYRFDEETPLDAEALQDYICSAFVGVTLNNFLFFPIACISLFALTKLVRRNNEIFARQVVWLFCSNPASVFFSTCYTESLYAALTFTALFMIEYKSTVYLSSHIESVDPTSNKGPLSQLNRLLYICSPCLPFLAFSTATRSNGLVNIGFIIYQLIRKYSHVADMDLSLISKLVYSLEIVQDILVVFMASVIAASGYISFQIYSYIKFCQRSDHKTGELTLKPSWCFYTFPHPYSQVQAKYWDVGLFRYYKLRQLPNFLLALPIIVMALVGSSRRARNIGYLQSGKRQLPYYIQLVILVILCGMTINIQVLTRLLASSCPALYWVAADISGESRFKNRMISMYFMTYLIVGTILHTTWYPWT